MINRKDRMLGRGLTVFACMSLLCISTPWAADPPPAVGYWFPNHDASTTFKYHIKQVWYDTRTTSTSVSTTTSRVGFSFVETGTTSFYYLFNNTSQLEVMKAGGIYSTLLTGLTTGKEVSLRIVSATGPDYAFDVVAVGPN